MPYSRHVSGIGARLRRTLNNERRLFDGGHPAALSDMLRREELVPIPHPVVGPAAHGLRITALPLPDLLQAVLFPQEACCPDPIASLCGGQPQLKLARGEGIQ